MQARPLFRLQALLLVALTLAVATGAPSHHHERPDTGPIAVDGDHHGHGTQLVDPGDRQTSELGALVFAEPPVVELLGIRSVVTAIRAPAARPLARGQPPPSQRPRAPPVSA